MRMHGENSHTGQTSKGVHLRKQGLAKAKFACAERTNYSLALAQNRGFCAKRRHNAPKEQGGLCTACVKGAFVSTREKCRQSVNSFRTAICRGCNTCPFARAIARACPVRRRRPPPLRGFYRHSLWSTACERSQNKCAHA